MEKLLIKRETLEIAYGALLFYNDKCDFCEPKDRCRQCTIVNKAALEIRRNLRMPSLNEKTN